MNRRDEVLAALRLTRGAAVSGEALAHDLNVSRAAIAKHVTSLRRAGYRIDAMAGSGYRLVGAPDTPSPAEVAPLLTSTRFTALEGGGPTGSTNDDAKALARDGAPDGTVVLASAQTAGRGRLGRSWSSPEGGVYLSIILRPSLSPAEAAPLALVVGLGAAEGLERLGVHSLLKWPNDLELSGRKLSGVLLEMSAETDRVEWVVAGIGLNVHRGPAHPAADHPVAAAQLAEAAYLADVAPSATLAQVAAAVLDGISFSLADFEANGFAALRARYAARDALVGRTVVVRAANGSEIAAGVALGVDGAGRLVLRAGSGEAIAVASGEVTLREAGLG